MKSVLQNVVADSNIPYLSIEGRTKSIEGCIEKAKRKNYIKPSTEMTDISGLRIILYFEHDIDPICKLVEGSFSVDVNKSVNKNDILKDNEVGYKSVHYICDVGETRSTLIEFKKMRKLKFEIQIRTIMQHAWSELDHDSNYKFSKELPKDLRRRLFLLAGMFETIDAGFSDLYRKIDSYMSDVSVSTATGHLLIDVNSLSVEQFIKNFAEKNSITLTESWNSSNQSALLREMRSFGINTLKDLNDIIPENYAKNLNGRSTTILGIVRHWMIISAPEKFVKKVKVSWQFRDQTIFFLRNYLNDDQIKLICDRIGKASPD